MDITKCFNEECINKNNCFRYTAKNTEPYQSYADFKPTNNTEKGFKCDFFWFSKNKTT